MGRRGEGDKEDGIFSTGEKTSGRNCTYLVDRLNYLPPKEMDTGELGPFNFFNYRKNKVTFLYLQVCDFEIYKHYMG